MSGLRAPVTDPFRRRWSRLLTPAVRLLALGVAVALATGATPAGADATVVPVSYTSRTTVQQLLVGLQTRSSSADPRYLAGAVWVDGAPGCLRCTLGPSVLAAARGRDMAAGNPWSRLAVTTMDAAIATHQRADGAYLPAGAGEGGPSIQTVLTANELAWTYLLLGSRLDPARRVVWSASLARSADWLIRNGDPAYYTNGNINLAIAMNLSLTHRITREPRFAGVAESSLDFATAPPQDRWPGFGLRYTRTPTRADGSDGAGYLAETGGGAPGYDPAYTLLQLDMAAMWFAVTGDPAALRLTNLLYNQVSSRVRTSDWSVDVGGGTRRKPVGVRYAFNSAALSVLALKGGRTDLVPLVRSQVSAALLDHVKASAYVNPGLSYNYGVELAPVYMVTTSTPGW